MVTDPISDFIIRIKNAARAGVPAVRLPYSQLKHAIADVLHTEGYLERVDKKGKKVKKTLEVTLAYDGSTPHFHDVERISKPSKRVYYSVDDIKPVRNGFGTIILSTPQGIMTGADAQKKRVGGEALFKIW